MTHAARWVIAVFVTSRLFYLLVGVALAGAVPVNGIQHQAHDNPFGRLSIWSHWDGEHYITIAEHGYKPSGQGSPAFFPLFPLVMRAATDLVGGPISQPALSLTGVIVSLAVLPFALWFVYRISEHELGPQVAKAATLLLAFSPMAFFFNAVYTESLFLALSAGAIWAALVRKNLLLACVLAALATATRNVGIFLVLPLALCWWRERQEWRWRGMYLAFAPAGLVAYATFLWARLGDPLAFASAQREWDRGFHGVVWPVTRAAELAWGNVSSIVQAIVHARGWDALFLASTRLELLADLVFLILGVVALALAAKRLRPELTLYALPLFLASLLFGTKVDPLMALPRYLVVVFPLFIAVGAVVGSRWRLISLTVLSGLASIPFVTLFVNWYFVA